MENLRNWVVIYDNGWEDVRIDVEEDGSIGWAYCDQAGSLEETSWKPGTSVSALRDWLTSHRITAASHAEGRHTAAWESLMSQFVGSDVCDLARASKVAFSA